MSQNVESIRCAERESHLKTYTEFELFELGSWLSKPVSTVIKYTEGLKNKTSSTIRILDLGCGVGRNAIAIANTLNGYNVNIECIDLLDFAIEKLLLNANKFSVEDKIIGTVSSIEEYDIKPNQYDMIVAVSTLEHVASKELFVRVLENIKSGLTYNGIACLVINSEVTEKDKATGKPMAPQFEVNYKTEELFDVLDKAFGDCDLLEKRVVEQKYQIPRGELVSDLKTSVVTCVFKKTIE
ncbi:MAG: class I SAM-dependent methyltransferase [Clostridia bacterium]|nr:class I SAM-dependent methyltransferase [Clostridia bacterium]